ncbi:MAG: O-antigen ligase family protein [Candidatus Hydrogenedentes bacterium]|nr:O-antigen ligase family protein [Candidatus Hydrogenedentota bacterium]
MHRTATRNGTPPIFSGLLVVSFGIVGAAALVYSFIAQKVIGISLLVGVLIPILALISGNPRMFFLVGFVLACPLDLSKYFRSYPHFGGEWALRIEAADPFLAVLLAFLLKDLFSHKLKEIRIPGIAMCWLLLLIMGVGSYYITVFRTLVGYEVIRMTKMLILYLYIVNHVLRRKQIEYVAATIVLAALIQVLYGITQYFGISLGLERLGESSQMTTEVLGLRTTSRVGAMLGHPNMFASYLVMVLPLAFAMLFARISPMYKGLCLSTLLLGVVTLILTLSRGGWIGFLCAVMALLVLSFFHPTLRKQAVAVRLFVLASLPIIVLALSGPIVKKFTLSDPASVFSRMELMRIAYRMIRQNLWTGVGLNSFTYVLPEYDFSGIVWGEMDPPVHNVYLLVGAEQGIFGLLLFLLMCFLIVYTGMKNLKCTDDLLLTVNIGILAGISGVLVQWMADWTLRVNAVQREFFLLVAMLTVIHYWNVSQEVTAVEEKPETLPAAVPQPT